MNEREENDFESNSETEDESNNSSKRKLIKKLKNNKKAKLSNVLPSVGKEKKKPNSLYNQPTAEELNKLRETENLFNSNIFRLQIDELLTEINVKEKHIDKFQTWFNTFQIFLYKIPEYEDIQLSGAKKSKHKKFINFLAQEAKSELFTPISDLSMKFSAPTAINGFRQFTSNVNSKYNPSIYVTLPKNLFFEKDYLNFKYFMKKYYYLMYLVHCIREHEDVKSAEVEYYLGNQFNAIISIVPKYSDKVTINLFAIPDVDTFKMNRFLPEKNNIKQNTLSSFFQNVKVENFSSSGTYLYNSLILFDVAFEINQKLIEDTLRHLSNAQDAIKLLTVWLQQRSLNLDYRSFTNDLIIYLIVYLAVKKKVNKHMSSYQVVRIFWSFLSTLNDEVLTICDDVKEKNLNEFKDQSHFVLLDASGCYNVAAFLHPDIYLKVKSEAANALKSLDSNKFNTFASLFTTKLPIGLQYDAILRIKDDDFSDLYEICADDQKFKYFGFYDMLIDSLISNQLKQGLTNRITHLIPIFSDETKESKHIFGISLNPVNCTNVIEKGPKQFEQGAEAFNKFWGSLAELRRFKDSSIHEAVYFEDVKTIQDRRLIFHKIINFVMEEKLSLSYDLHGIEMEKILNLNNVIAPFPTGSNEEATLKVKSIHYELSQILRDLQLPLAITAIQGISDVFSYTDIFPQLPTNYNEIKAKPISKHILINDNPKKRIPTLVQPIECVVQLALHSKWPRELKALRAMKQAFNFELSQLLQKHHKILSCVSADYVDVYYEGLVFRMIIYHPKEVALLKKDISADGVTSYKDTEESLKLERNFEVLPKITGALNGIQQECPSFGPSTCLIKRWLRSQMLDDYHISDVVINLLNASLFLSSEPFDTPTLPQVAFLRFLKFMSVFDFNLQPIIANFNNDMPGESLNELETKFLQHRQNYNNLHIVTPFDDGKSLFTKNSPTPTVLKRIKYLAMATYTELINGIHKESSFKYKRFFVPNLEGYNLLIHINAYQNTRIIENITNNNNSTTKLESYNLKYNTKIPVVGFEPVQLYLKELRANYSNYALFFHDTYGGNTIGVLWKENVLDNIDFKVSTVSARKVSSGKMVLNMDALIEDFYILGKDLVRTIDVQKN